MKVWSIRLCLCVCALGFINILNKKELNNFYQKTYINLNRNERNIGLFYQIFLFVCYFRFLVSLSYIVSRIIIVFCLFHWALRAHNEQIPYIILVIAIHLNW